MQKTVFLLLAILFEIQLVFAGGYDSIEIQQGALGKKFMYKSEQIKKINDFGPILMNHQNAEKYYANAKALYWPGQIFGFIGGALIGWPIGTAIAGGEPLWILAGIGGGVVLIALPFGISSEINLRKAAEAYNSEVKIFSNQNLLEFRLCITHCY